MVTNITQFVELFNPRVIFEIGVGNIKSCRTLHQWGNKEIECHLFEPNPFNLRDLRWFSKDFENVFIYDVAISNTSEYKNLYLMENCSFLDGIDSPVLEEHGQKMVNESKSIKVKTETIEKYDKGNINFLLIDTEGCEWFVLEKLISRPKMIIVETHVNSNKKQYLNKYIDNILRWTWENEYQLIYKDESDSCWARTDVRWT